MKNNSYINVPEEFADELGFTGDSNLSDRLSQAIQAERGPVMTVLFEAKDIVLGGLNGARKYPSRSLEIAAASVATGIAAALARETFKHRPAH